MDDVDKDIERSKIGRRREEAYEIINHHPITSTIDLPPIKAINKVTPHVCDTCSFNAGEIEENGITKLYCKKIDHRIKKKVNEYCSFWGRK